MPFRSGVRIDVYKRQGLGIAVKMDIHGPKRYAIPETWYKQSGTSGTPELQSILRGLLLLHSASALSGRTERSADSLRLLPSGTPHRMPAGSLDKVNPVSYTHLDVYKRQLKYHSCRSLYSDSVTSPLRASRRASSSLIKGWDRKWR